MEHIAGLHAGSRVLEGGYGTGQATRALAQRSFSITAVELSPALAALARWNLKDFQQAHVLTGDFEEWPLPEQPFDLAVAAQALHWIDPRVRFTKLAAALAQGGYCAIFGHLHVAGGTGDFFLEAQHCYERFMPGTPKDLRLVEADALAYDDLGMAASGLFETPERRRYPWSETYTTGEYLNLLRTFSNHIHLESSAHDALPACIARLIDERYGGAVEKATVVELVIGRKTEKPGSGT